MRDTNVKPTRDAPLNKAPPAILMFWLVKTCDTTVGETGGEAVSKTLGLG